jgi:YbbR domain-containing protein
VPVLASEGELGGLPPGFRLGSVEVDVDEATVTGREQLVADVAFVQPDIDLMGARTDFEQRAPLEAIGQGGGLLQGVTIEPETAVVTVDIVQTEFTSTFLVRPIVRGQPASGFRVTGLEWDPVFVEVTGTLEALSNIDPVRGVETEPLNIDGATSDVVSTRALRVPSGAEAEVANVTIRVTIEAQPAPQQQSSRGSPWLGAWRPRLS